MKLNFRKNWPETESDFSYRPILTQISVHLFMLDLTVIKRVGITTSLFVLDIISNIFGINCLFQNYPLKHIWRNIINQVPDAETKRVTPGSFRRNDCIFSHDVISSHSSYSIQSRTQIHVLVYSKLSSMHCFTERKPIICSAHLTRQLSWTSEINAYNIAMKWVYMNTNTGLEASATRST